ncbi:MAG: hypothetical protein KDA41_03630, partial [Planctomycetales bacterium]|nr:hypothetical protein [Planctomycetales bacterium]
MAHPLEQKVHRVRRLARRVRWVVGLAWLTVCGLAAALIAGGGDYLLRSEETGVRLILSLLVVAASAAAFWRFLRPAIVEQDGDLSVALRIERRWPQLHQRLSSSLEFLQQAPDDAFAGSPALRRTVVAEATAQVEALPLHQIVDVRRQRPALAAAGLLLFVVGLLWLAAPQTVGQAARRLALPLSTDRWPRRHHLQYVDPPAHVSFGEPFRVEVKDAGGDLPEALQVYYRFAGQSPTDAAPQPMTFAGDKAVHQLNRVTQPFQVRVVGGDDDTLPWIDVAVVEPSRLEELRVTLHPPAYTGIGPSASSPHIAALAGTRVALAAAVTKPIKAARVLIDCEGQAQEIPLTVAADGLGASLSLDGPQPWLLEKSGSYCVLLVGADGVESGRNERHDLVVRADAAPRISIDSPPGNLFVTPEAVAVVAGTVRDDLAIRRVELRFTRSDA